MEYVLAIFYDGLTSYNLRQSTTTVMTSDLRYLCSRELFVFIVLDPDHNTAEN